MNKYWSIRNLAANAAEILIYEEIGKSWWDDSGVSAKEFIEDLRSRGDITDIDLRINSIGGNVFEGLAIYNIIKQHPANVNVYIDGIAASISSVIAMSGNKIIMPANTQLLIHDPMSGIDGTAEEMRGMADDLDKVKTSIMTVYMDRTGLAEQEISDLMSAETLMTAEEAIEKGFADEMTEEVAASNMILPDLFQNVSKKTLSAIRNLYEKDVRLPQKKENSTNNKSEELKNEQIKNDEKEVRIKMKKEIDEAGKEGQAIENKRVGEILDIGEKYKCSSLAAKAIREKTPVEDFKGSVLEEVFNAKKDDNITGELGLSRTELNNYSITETIRNLAEFKPLDGIVKEASNAMAKLTGKSPKGFFIPQDVMKDQVVQNITGAINALEAGDATKGGYLVGTEVRTSDMIELLRNKMLVAQMGATTLSGLMGNVAIPKLSGGATAYFLPESGEVPASEQAFKQLGLVPHRLVADTAFSKELVAQTSADVESLVRMDLMRVIAIKRDLVALAGSGNDGEPTGLMNVDGIGSVTFGGAPTWAKAVEFETDVANSNADIGQLGYLMPPTVRGKWKTTVKVSNFPSFLWENGAAAGSGIVNGYRAEATNQVPDSKVIFGNWNDLILAEWAGVDVVVDPYSLKKTGQIEITITIYVDNGIRHEGSFSVSTDSGAQA